MTDLIKSAAHSFHGAIAIDSGRERIRFKQLDEIADGLAHHLSIGGHHANDRVGLLAKSSLRSVLGFWGLLRAGIVACPIDPRLPQSAIETAAKIAMLSRVFADEELPNISNHRLSRENPRAESRESASLATILFSSGSTGDPKAIAHRIEAHIASAEGANQNLALREGDSWLLSLPFFHVAGIGILFRCALAGACVSIPHVSKTLIESIDCFQPTHLSLIPTQLMRLVWHYGDPPTCLKTVLLGGGPIPNELAIKALERGWPLRTTYGLSEMASQVTATSDRPNSSELKTAGRCLPFRELRISDDGEIQVRGETLFDGYVNGHTTTQELTPAGWFATGDRGRIDHAGRLIVLGRIDNQFVSGGENIYPEELEREILTLPGVRQVVVVAVPHPEFGERPVAFVDADGQTESAWLARLEKKLPRFKLPDKFLPWPAQHGLKPNRRRLRSLAIQILGDRPHAP